VSTPPPPPALPPTAQTNVTPQGADRALTGATPTVDSGAITLNSAPNDQLPQLRPPLVPGDLGAFGRHRVLRILGRGGMGVVYEALDPALRRRVALKLMLPVLDSTATGRERFLREARAAAAIRHENVVSVYQVGEDEGAPFLTMELLHGDHLAHLIGNGLPLADVVRIGREVALGLAAAHTIGVVHRDIKPANIWIESPSQRVKVLDFGLARIGGEVSITVRSRRPTEGDLTQVGELIGTVAYMSPEQLDGRPIDCRTDLFGLGAVLYQMVTGRVPFSGKTISECADAIRAGVFAPVSAAAPTAPPALARLIHALLAPQPEDRPRSADVVAEKLLAIGTQLLINTGSASAPVSGPRAPAGAPAAGETDSAFEFPVGPPTALRRPSAPTLFLLGGTAVLVIALLLVGVLQRMQEARHAEPVVGIHNPTPPNPPPPPANPLPKGFVSLFNGTDLSGWRSPAEGPSDTWSVANGALVGTPKPNVHAQALLTEQGYADFELRLEYRWMTPGGHTIVVVRASADKEKDGKGLAISLADDEGFRAVHGREADDTVRTGAVLNLTSRPPAANKPRGEWNSLRVLARRHVIEVELNGTKMPTADLDTKLDLLKTHPEYYRAKGPIGLWCFYGTIEYRKVIIHPFPE
jgi:serine/threonine protein kinase